MSATPIKVWITENGEKNNCKCHWICILWWWKYDELAFKVISLILWTYPRNQFTFMLVFCAKQRGFLISGAWWRFMWGVHWHFNRLHNIGVFAWHAPPPPGHHQNEGAKHYPSVTVPVMSIPEPQYRLLAVTPSFSASQWILTTSTATSYALQLSALIQFLLMNVAQRE